MICKLLGLFNIGQSNVTMQAKVQFYYKKLSTYYTYKFIFIIKHSIVISQTL